MKIFLSYARQDYERVRPIAQILESWGHTVFLDKMLSVGEDFRSSISKWIEESHVVLVFWSIDSVSSISIRAEADAAFVERKLLPVVLDEVEVPIPFNTLQQVRLVDIVPDEKALYFLREALGYFERRPRAARKSSLAPEAQTPPLPPPIIAVPTPPQPLPASPPPEQEQKSFDVFISYSRKDSDTCRALFELLVQEDLNPWYDEEIGAGQYKETIADLISEARVFVVLLSENSLASANVRKELTLAANGGPVIVPIAIDHTDVPDLKGAFAYELAELNILRADPVDLSKWTKIIETIGTAARKLKEIQSPTRAPLPAQQITPQVIRPAIKPPEAPPPASSRLTSALAFTAWTLLTGLQIAALGYLAMRHLPDPGLAAAWAVAASIVVLPVMASVALLVRRAFG